MKIAVIYWSGTGNTKAMAEAMLSGAKAGGADAELFAVKEFKGDLSSYDAFILGCAARGNEELSDKFNAFFEDAKPQLKDKTVALFGSYGWGKGKYLATWADTCKQSGINVFDEGITFEGAPDSDALNKCEEYAEKFVKSL